MTNDDSPGATALILSVGIDPVPRDTAEAVGTAKLCVSLGAPIGMSSDTAASRFIAANALEVDWSDVPMSDVAPYTVPRATVVLASAAWVGVSCMPRSCCFRGGEVRRLTGFGFSIIVGGAAMMNPSSGTVVAMITTLNTRAAAA